MSLRAKNFLYGYWYLSLLVLMVLLPQLAFAYMSPISNPHDGTVVLPIQDASRAQQFFGKLAGFPHTYEFSITKSMHFSASIEVPNYKQQKHDVALILIKEEKHGVSEVARTLAKDQSFAPQYDAVLATTFLSGGTINSELGPGTYRLEVSSPDDDALYKLTFGAQQIHWNYADALQYLFEVNGFLGHSFFHLFLSVLIYVPIALIVLSFFAFSVYKKRDTI